MPEKIPPIAVCIPSFNHAAYIGAALESVAAQTQPPARVVVVDDGSTDDSLDVIRAFAEAHPGLDVHLLTQPNAGAHHALNRAVSAAGDGELVAILNSDDLYEPTRLAQCAAFLERNPSAQAVCTGLRMIDPSGAFLPAAHPKARRLRTLWEHPQRDPAEWLGVANFTKTTSNLVIRADYARAHPFEPYRYVHDYAFALEAAFEGALAVLPAPLLRYRTHTANTIKADGPARVAAETVRMVCGLLKKLAPRLKTSAEMRAAATRCFRTLCWNSTDFRMEVFLAVMAEALETTPDSPAAPADFPELSAPPLRHSAPRQKSAPYWPRWVSFLTGLTGFSG